MKLTLQAVFVWLTLGTAAADPHADGDLELVTKLRLSADRIEYSGVITAEANTGVFELYDAAHPKPRTVLIESPGGGAAAGMQLGSWMLSKGMDVEVGTYCFSSCANYVFLAGRRKILAPHASLMWHGGVTQPITLQALGQVLDQLLADMSEDERRSLLMRSSRSALLQQLDLSRRELITQEVEFFEAIGVDQRITTLGHLYERELLQGEGNYLGWDYSLEDLARLGVRQIRLRGGGQWQPAFPVPGRRIYRIDLDDLRDFEPRVPPQPPADDPFDADS